LEEADAYFRLNDEFGHTQEKVAEKIGKNRSTIANLLRLRSLPNKIKESLLSEKITMGHARALLGGGSEENQLYLFKQVRDRGLSVRETERLVNQAKKEPRKLAKKISATEKILLDKVSTRISTQIKSQVKIKKEGEKGRIEIKFTSKLEFDRLVDLLSSIT
ncbi:MAG: chromosome partitioning protein ParB, partial [Desulfobacteraceae bacterium 4572_89]